MANVLSKEEFKEHVRPLLGLEVSLAWKGYGSAIFLELGQLSPPQGDRAHHESGEARLMIEWDWRIESRSSVQFGSSNSGPQIEVGIRGLEGSRIEEIAAVGSVPELEVAFSNGRWLRSMVTLNGDPQWGVKLTSGSWLQAREGDLWFDAQPVGITDAEEAAWKLSETTRDWWGVPHATPVNGRCADCRWFRRVDGEGYLLDYGVCIAESSPFDGRVVNRSSGCPVFGPADEV